MIRLMWTHEEKRERNDYYQKGNFSLCLMCRNLVISWKLSPSRGEDSKII